MINIKHQSRLKKVLQKCYYSKRDISATLVEVDILTGFTQ